MRKALILLSICLATVSAHAEDWQLLQEAENGVRMLVDIKSIAPINMTSHGMQGPAIGAKFRYIDDNGVATVPFIFVTAISSCKSMNGELQQGTLQGGKWVPEKKYWWSENGSKMYDASGNFLCKVYNRVTAAQQMQVKPVAPGRNSI